jgi:hypothetical protein
MTTKLSEKIKKISGIRQNSNQLPNIPAIKTIKQRGVLTMSPLTNLEHSTLLKPEAKKNEPQMFFLLKNTKGHKFNKAHAQHEFLSFQNNEKIKKEEAPKYNFRKLSDSFQKKNPENPNQPNFFLKNDYIQMPNRVFLTKKMAKIDKKIIDSMFQLFKRLKNSKEIGNFLSETKKKNENKRLFVSDLAVEKTPVLNNGDNKEKEDNLPNIKKKEMKKKYVSREEKVKKLLNMNFSQKIKDIQTFLKKKNNINKKVSFQV